MNYCDNLLIIPDVHQKVNWVRSILEKEKGKFDRVLFLGDFFDAFNAEPGSVQETAQFIMRFKSLNPSTIFILGNHDLHYYENLSIFSKGLTPKFARFACSGYSNTNGILLSKYISPEFAASCKVAAAMNGFIFSHGGILPHLWPMLPGHSDLECLDKMLAHFDWVYKDFRIESDNPVFWAGWASGDMHTPGPIWTRFEQEFLDDLPFPQIVGHTPIPLSPRRKGRSWCLDGAASCYGVLSRSGKLRIGFSLNDKNLEDILNAKYKDVA